MSHTPGPWEVGMTGRTAETGTFTYIVNCEGRPVGGVWGAEDEEPRANIALVAAAPDLLKALKDVLDVCHDYLTHEQQGHAYEQLGWARAVVERAEKGSGGFTVVKKPNPQADQSCHLDA